MWRVVSVLLSVITLNFSSGHLYGQISDDLLEQTRQNGIDYLKSEQQPDGSWQWEKRQVSITALCTLALLENGLSERDPVVERGIQFVRRNINENDQTDAVALSIMLLSRIGQEVDKPRLQNLTNRLIAAQSTSGGWSETCPLKKPKKRDKPNDSLGDNRSTQFAVMGLWAASQSGVKVGNAMTDVALRFFKTQNKDGGWGRALTRGFKLRVEQDIDEKTNSQNPENNPGDPMRFGIPKKQATTGSMTFASLFCLTVSKATRPQKRKGGPAISEEISNDNSGTLIENSVFKKGLATAVEYLEKAGAEEIQKKVKTEPNPNEPPGDPSLRPRGKKTESAEASPYFFWMVERLGVLLGEETFGQINWFDKGAKLLIDAQRENGSWSEHEEDDIPVKGEYNSLHDTAFAILFLRRATLGSEASRLLNGKSKRSFKLSHNQTNLVLVR